MGSPANRSSTKAILGQGFLVAKFHAFAAITKVAVDFEPRPDGLAITATVRTDAKTGVEMEALTAVTVAALSIVDMIKGVDRTAAIRVPSGVMATA